MLHLIARAFGNWYGMSDVMYEDITHHPKKLCQLICFELRPTDLVLRFLAPHLRLDSFRFGKRLHGA